MRVVLVDDHTLVRSGIRALLEAMPGVEVVGEASDGKDAIALVCEKKPDVVLLDIAMKEMNGLDATTRLRKEAPDVRVVILTMHATGDYVQQALAAGASAYLMKDAAPLELEFALSAVSQGNVYLSPAVSSHVVECYLQPDKIKRPDGLTSRQLLILRMIARGDCTKEIASQLEVSVKTVETHRAHIMEKLQIRDVAGLVRYAIKNGLVDIDG